MEEEEEEEGEGEGDQREEVDGVGPGEEKLLSHFLVFVLVRRHFLQLLPSQLLLVISVWVQGQWEKYEPFKEQMQF